MKLIIQIPCFNEQETLRQTLDELPQQLEGFDKVEVLVIDDGSTDRTVQVARDWGVDHILSLPANRGLANAFMKGLDKAVALGADVIVNTDADNQYNAADIPLLVAPILENRAEMVVGARPIADIEHFSPVKRLLQKVGSWVVRIVSSTDVPDAPSGFRAFSREAAMKLNVFSSYTYTIETIIQAGQKGLAVTSIPIRVNEDLRPSRLVRSIPSYVYRSIVTIVRIFLAYKPLKFFLFLGAFPFAIGFLLGVRFVVYFLLDAGEGKVQSLILASMLMLIGFGLWVVALLSDLISVNRQLLEKLDWRIHQLENDDKRE